ncbi:MAG: hypothetical protein GY870_09860 [archaeon]|nr:hypothetical protein [archaeon]
MIEKDEELMDQILNKILRTSAGIRYVLLMDRTGLTITHATKFRTQSYADIDRLGAIAGAVFQATEEQGDCLAYGGIESSISEYNEGFIFSMSAKEGILCVATDKQINLGLIRSVMKKYRAVLASILDRYLEHEDVNVSKELKALLGSEKEYDFSDF